jgi:Thioesterase-like superfamily
MTAAFFQLGSGSDKEELISGAIATSRWGHSQLRGMAVSGALARAVEKVAPDPASGFRPARWTVDMWRPVAAAPCHTTAQATREGRRLLVVDAELAQGGHTVARATCVFLRPVDLSRGSFWQSTHPELPQPPAPDWGSSGGEPRLYWTADRGWRVSADPRSANARLVTWHRPIPIVESEVTSPFQFAASVADAANVVTNYGSAGLEFINVDITLGISRVPDSLEVGLAATSHLHEDGLGSATATMYDRRGALGSVLISGLANRQQTVASIGRGGT